MNTLISLHHAIFTRLSALGDIITPTLARFVFGAVLLQHYWASAGTKLDGFLGPSDGGYIQIFPKAVEAAGYDTSQLGIFHWAVVMAGTYAEYVLPFMIIIGFLTRFAAIGMSGFVFVQSIVDITGHGVGGADLGARFDKASGALIMDQRTLWGFVLIVLVVRGAGPFSVDRLLKRAVA